VPEDFRIPLTVRVWFMTPAERQASESTAYDRVVGKTDDLIAEMKEYVGKMARQANKEVAFVEAVKCFGNSAGQDLSKPHICTDCAGKCNWAGALNVAEMLARYIMKDLGY
jgi:hypothetical protein